MAVIGASQRSSDWSSQVSVSFGPAASPLMSQRTRPTSSTANQITSRRSTTASQTVGPVPRPPSRGSTIQLAGLRQCAGSTSTSTFDTVSEPSNIAINGPSGCVTRLTMKCVVRPLVAEVM
jgi:hypothetical protein